MRAARASLEATRMTRAFCEPKGRRRAMTPASAGTSSEITVSVLPGPGNPSPDKRRAVTAPHVDSDLASRDRAQTCTNGRATVSWIADASVCTLISEFLVALAVSSALL